MYRIFCTDHSWKNSQRRSERTSSKFLPPVAVAGVSLLVFAFSPQTLKELIEARGITRYRLAKLADTRFEVVEKWCSGTVERIDSDVLARFCYILDCQITDIIHYQH